MIDLSEMEVSHKILIYDLHHFCFHPDATTYTIV